MAKSLLRIKARALRAEGLAIKSIATKLGVSSSTVSLWCRDIQLSESQIKLLELHARDPLYGKRLSYAKKQQELRQRALHKIVSKAQRQTARLGHRSLFISGVSLYWAEGFKKDNQVGFANSDPDMIKFFIHWLERCCHVSRGELRFRLTINEQHKERLQPIQDYWISNLGVDSEQFQKPFYQRTNWKKVYDNFETYHGVLRVRVCKSSKLLWTILGWIDGLKNAKLMNSLSRFEI